MSTRFEMNLMSLDILHWIARLLWTMGKVFNSWLSMRVQEKMSGIVLGTHIKKLIRAGSIQRMCLKLRIDGVRVKIHNQPR